MFNLFQKKPKVKVGNSQSPAATQEKKKAGSPLAGFVGGFKKLNSMDRKQAYTWGGIGLVILVSLLMLAGISSKDDPEDFSDFESRGYDLANMPFSSDEAEQYLLAAKYPDMQGKTGGLYSEESKQARQEKEAEEAGKETEENFSSGGMTSGGGYYGGGGYHGGGGRRSGSPTTVNTMNSASLKGASGSAMSGTFGPKGDFSNFRSQDKASGSALPTNRGSGSARKALYQTAQGSRAAAGLKDGKSLNAKKALMGGNIQGADAFAATGNGVDLRRLGGQGLDTDAPMESADLGNLGNELEGQTEEAEDEITNDEDECSVDPWKNGKCFGQWLKQLGADMIRKFTETIVTNATNLWMDNWRQNNQANRYAEATVNAQCMGESSCNREEIRARARADYFRYGNGNGNGNGNGGGNGGNTTPTTTTPTTTTPTTTTPPSTTPPSTTPPAGGGSGS